MNWLKNYLSTMWFIWFMYWFYNHVDYYINFFNRSFNISHWWVSFTTQQLFLTIIAFYTIFLMIYYAIYKERSTAREIVSYIYSQFTSTKQKWDEDIKQSFLKAGVKFFYVPIMIFWFVGHATTVVNNLYLISTDVSMASVDFVAFFIKHLFWNLFTLILFVDVFFFTVWYMTEWDDVLHNKIRSAQPYAIWWIVTLMCYPPFNALTTWVVDRYSTDFPQFTNTTITVIIWFLICILMGIYSWASVALWWKASNLTNRGIVARWPYRFIRHPAYITKNIAWMLWTLPIAISFISQHNRSWLFYLILSVICRWAIYHARAVTEEMHLSLDPDYIDYKKKVPYRYIPGIY